MVTVPRYYDSTSLRGRNQQTRSGQANGFGQYVGQGLAVLAQGITSAADALDYRDTVKAEADARNATNTYREVLRSGLYDPETGYLNQTGNNALEGAREETFDTLSAARDKIAGELSPRAQKSFGTMADNLDNTAKDTAIRHEGVEFRDFTMQSFEGAAQGYLDDAILNWSDDGKFGQNLSAAEIEIRNAAALQGTAPDMVQQQIDEIRSTAHAGRVVEIARSNPIAAYDYLQENSDSIDRQQYDRLHTGLEPAYYNAQARVWVSENNASVVSSGHINEDQYGVPSWLAAAESSNNPNAENPYSSATGRVQFIRSTYLEYVSRVNPEWAQGLTEAEILDTRRDPAKEAEIYRAFRADNQEYLTSGGFEVNPRNEYVMHHMGPKMALALLYAEQTGTTNISFYTQMVSVIGAEAADANMAANAWMHGKTVAGALNFFASKANTSSSGAVVSPAIAMQQALDITDPKLRSAVLSELELRQSVAHNVRTEETRAANEAAYDIIDNGGSANDIPPDLQAQVGVGVMNDIFNQIQRRATGVDYTDEARHLELIDLSTSDPQAFASLDLNEDRPNLSRGDLLTLKAMQQDITNAVEQAKTNGAASLVYSDTDMRNIVNDGNEQYKAATGITPGMSMTQEQMAQYNRFTQQLRQGVNAFTQEHGRKMSFEERTSFINTLLAPVVIDGVDRSNLPFNAGDAFLFEVPSLARADAGVEMQYGIGDVPPDDETRIKAALTQSFGREPSEDEIIEQFENEVLMSVGISPTIEYREVPKDIRRSIFEEYPDASDEEVVDIFLGLTLEAAIYSLQGDP